jgi:trimethylamine--corrinoid protein Co-methyltransferase
LSGAGCEIFEEIRKGHKIKAVRISPEIAKKSLGSAPKTINLYTTTGELKASLGGNTPAFSTGSSGRVFWDGAAGARRSTSSDLGQFIRVADYLEHIDMVSTAMVPHDVEPKLQDAYRLLEVFKNSQKPVVTGIYPQAGESNFERMKDMLLVIRGSEEGLKKSPLAIFDVCPDPLKWSKTLSECLIDCGKYGIPAEIISMPQPGLSYPATLYEAIVQSTAETFAGFVISQAAHPGAPVIWGGSASSINFEGGRTDTQLASPEVMKIIAAYAAVAQKYGLPTHAYAIADSPVIDAQYGIEKQRTISLAMRAGISHITGLGMFGEEDILSCESLVIDNDIVGCEKYLAGGIRRNRKDPFADISFLADEGVIHPETAKFLRSGEFFSPRAFDRDRTKPMLERAVEVVNEILKKHRPEYLSDEQERALKACLS